MSLITTYTGLKTVLQTKLSGLKGSDNTALFSGVYVVSETEVAGYPCAFIVESAGEGQILDTHRNEREWQFVITILQEASAKTPENAKIALLDAVDRVLTSFDQDPMLLDVNGDGQVQRIRAIPVEFEYGSGDGAKHIATLKVSCVNLVNTYA